MTRSITEIAREIKQKWEKPHFAAVPYLNAMLQLKDAKSMYGADDAESVVMYFLSNAQGWRGEDAKRIKAELKLIFKRG